MERTTEPGCTYKEGESDSKVFKLRFETYHIRRIRSDHPHDEIEVAWNIPWYHFIYLVCSVHMPTALAAESQISCYIILNISGTSQQKIYVYNQGRQETQIRQDNSMIPYTYDQNGNLLKKSTAYSTESYVFSTSAVSYDIYLKGFPENVHLVQFPTWTEQNGQDDIDWIVGEKVAPGLWKRTVVFSKQGGDVHHTCVYGSDGSSRFKRSG